MKQSAQRGVLHQTSDLNVSTETHLAGQQPQSGKAIRIIKLVSAFKVISGLFRSSLDKQCIQTSGALQVGKQVRKSGNRESQQGLSSAVNADQPFVRGTKIEGEERIQDLEDLGFLLRVRMIAQVSNIHLCIRTINHFLASQFTYAVSAGLLIAEAIFI